MALGCYNPDDVYLPASFKGISFLCEGADSEHGRRGAEGEFPFGETTGYADLGRRIRTYTLRAWFPQNNHVIQSGLLIAACESPGPGLLVHPTRGIVMVGCRSCRVQDNPKDQTGVTYVDLDFVEANDTVSGFGFGSSIVMLGLTAILLATTESFRRSYRPTSVRWYDAPTVVTTMNAAVEELQSAYTNLSSTDESDTRNQIVRDFRNITIDEFALNDTETAITVLQNAFTFIDGAGTGSDKVTILRQVINWATQQSPLDGEAGQAQNIIFTAVRVIGAAYLAKAFTETQPNTVDEGLRQFDMVMQILDQEAEIANTDCLDTEYFLAIRAFGTSVSRVMIQRAYESPSLIVYQFPGTVHSLVAAWEIFGDAKRSRDIEMRNIGAPWAVGPQIIAESVSA